MREINLITDRARAVGKLFSELKKLGIKRVLTNGSLDPEERLVRNIEAGIADLPETDRLWRGLDPENCNKNFKELTVSIQRAGLSWQKHLFRVQNLEISELQKKLSNLNQSIKEQQKKYHEIESELVKKRDLKIRD
jgi:hypothetical protein